jgi:general stress protein YciG
MSNHFYNSTMEPQKITDAPKSKKGFASMTPEKRREIASLGGKKAQELGTGHRFTSEEAARAGQLGGKLGKRGKTVKPAVVPQVVNEPSTDSVVSEAMLPTTQEEVTGY